MAATPPMTRLRARLHEIEQQFYAGLKGRAYDQYRKVYVEHRRLLRILLNPLRDEIEGRITADALADFLWNSKLCPDEYPERWVKQVHSLFKKLPFVTYHPYTQIFTFDLFVEANGGATALERRRKRAKKLRAARKRRCVSQPDRAAKQENFKKVTPKVKKCFPNLQAPLYNGVQGKPAAASAVFGAQGRLQLEDSAKSNGKADKALPPSQQAPQGANKAKPKLELAPPPPLCTPKGGFAEALDDDLQRESAKPGFDPRKCKTVLAPSHRLTKAEFEALARQFPFLLAMKWWLFSRNCPQYTSTLNAVLLADSGVRKGTLHNPCGAVVVAEGRLRGVRDEQWRVAA